MNPFSKEESKRLVELIRTHNDSFRGYSEAEPEQKAARVLEAMTTADEVVAILKRGGLSVFYEGLVYSVSSEGGLSVETVINLSTTTRGGV